MAYVLEINGTEPEYRNKDLRDIYENFYRTSGPMKDGEEILVLMTYFKDSGKYYSQGLAKVLKRPSEIYPIDFARTILKELGRVPGLAGKWDGPVLVESGFPQLIYLHGDNIHTLSYAYSNPEA